MTEPSLFDSMGPVDYGRPRVSLSAARELVAAVEEMCLNPEWVWGQTSALVERARNLGAHALARMIWYVSEPGLWSRPYCRLLTDADITEAARRWLARIEAERVRG